MERNPQKDGMRMLSAVNSLNDICVEPVSLSEIPIPSRYYKSSSPPIPVHNGYGRGRASETLHEITRNWDHELTSPFTDYSPPQGTWSGGRGRAIQASIETMKLRGENELKAQLRKVCGSGFSNDLIESYWKSKMECQEPARSRSSCSNDVEHQFEDACPAEEPEFHLYNDTEIKSPDEEKEPEVTKQPVVINESLLKPVIKPKARHCRNVLLQNLLKLNSTPNDTEIETDSRSVGTSSSGSPNIFEDSTMKQPSSSSPIVSDCSKSIEILSNFSPSLMQENFEFLDHSLATTDQLNTDHKLYTNLSKTDIKKKSNNNNNNYTDASIQQKQCLACPINFSFNALKCINCGLKNPEYQKKKFANPLVKPNFYNEKEPGTDFEFNLSDFPPL